MADLQSDTKDVPLLSFGAIADVQHADIPNGMNFKKTKVRYYRNSLNILSDAVDCWKNSEPKIEFVLQLGDVIDGFNMDTPGENHASLQRTMDLFSQLDCPVYHTIGNHELYNFQRPELNQTVLNSTLAPAVESPKDPKGIYYHFSPLPGFRIVMLDTYDVSLLGLDKQSEEYLEILEEFRKVNKNEETHSPDGIPDELCMYAAYNGGVSDKQLGWLETVLTDADSHNERVIVAGHCPIHKRATTPFCMCWNHAEILTTIQRHPSVLAYLAGHFHTGGYKRDSEGIHHVTFPGVIDTAPDTSCHGILRVYEDRVELEGFGRVESRTLRRQTCGL